MRKTYIIVILVMLLGFGFDENRNYEVSKNNNISLVPFPNSSDIAPIIISNNETIIQITEPVDNLTYIKNDTKNSKKNDTKNTDRRIDLQFSNTTLWEYKGDCTLSGIKGSCEPWKYIMPDNTVVRYVASYIEIRDGKPYWVSENPWGYYGQYSNLYVPDYDQFGRDDYWINPDYYFTHGNSAGFKGDCEDAAIALASVLEAKGIKTKVVSGHLNYEGKHVIDTLTEYKINGTYYRYYANSVDIIKSRKYDVMDFKPVWMFDRNTSYVRYNPNW